MAGRGAPATLEGGGDASRCSASGWLPPPPMSPRRCGRLGTRAQGQTGSPSLPGGLWARWACKPSAKRARCWRRAWRLGHRDTSSSTSRCFDACRRSRSGRMLPGVNGTSRGTRPLSITNTDNRIIVGAYIALGGSRCWRPTSLKPSRGVHRGPVGAPQRVGRGPRCAMWAPARHRDAASVLFDFVAAFPTVSRRYLSEMARAAGFPPQAMAVCWGRRTTAQLGPCCTGAGCTAMSLWMPASAEIALSLPRPTSCGSSCGGIPSSLSAPSPMTRRYYVGPRKGASLGRGWRRASTTAWPSGLGRHSASTKP